MDSRKSTGNLLDQGLGEMLREPDLAGVSFEDHVKSALGLARERSAAKPISAADALFAACEARELGGTAFRVFAELVGDAPPPKRGVSVPSDTDLYGIALNDALRASYDIVRLSSSDASEGLWGRDYVTFALFADDPSLLEWPGATKLPGLREAWFQYLIKEGVRRPPDAWARLRDTLTAELVSTQGQISEPAAVSSRQDQPGERAPRLEGVTVSHHNGSIDWKQVAQAGYRFAFCKATEGIAKIDPRFDENWRGSREALPYRAAYHVGVPNEDALAQAEHFHKVVGSPVRGDLPPVLDIEGAGGLGSEELNQWALVFLQRTERLFGTRPMVYLTGTIWRQSLRETPQLAQYPLFIADFTGDAFPARIPAWTQWTFWHCTARGTVPGISGNATDLVRFVAGENELRSLAYAPPPEELKLGRIESISVFANDVPDLRSEEKDCISVVREAKAFARIVAAKRTTPPLAIGVFGEWGSGKTFFMNVMERHIKSLAKAGSESPFYQKVVHITFNAWHYMETNLWASLVDHIFQELDRWLDEKEKPDKSDALFGSLETAQQLSLEAVQATIRSYQRRKLARDNLKAVQLELEHARSRADFSIAATAALKTLFKDPKRYERLKEVCARLGITELGGRVRELVALADTTTTTIGRARSALGFMVTLGTGKPALALGVVWALLLTSLLFVLKEAFSSRLDWLDKCSDWIAAASGVLASLIATMGRALARSAGALKALEDFHGELQELGAPSEEALSKARADVTKLEADVEAATKNLASAFSALEAVRAEMLAATPRARLRSFIRAKATGGDYAKHLSLVSTIRKDFEQLTNMMRDVRKSGGEEMATKEEGAQQPFRAKMKALLEEARALGKNGELNEEELSEFEKQLVEPPKKREEPPFFERIVLYIDDLDRCPASKVVDVLQAIHLLLYFRLFVVVVAVDARWVSRALKQEYPNLLAETVTYLDDWGPRRPGTLPSKSRGRQGSSQDYLEKIFQIPYWVRPMDADAGKKYVEMLLAASPAASNAAAESRNLTNAAVAQQAQPPSEGLASEGASEPPTRPSELHETPAESAGEVRSLEKVGARPESSASQAGAEESASYVAKSLELTEYEKIRLKELAPYAGGSPRRGLRFVNVYRLIRTSLTPEELDRLVGKQGEELGYRALIVLVAIATGAPLLAQYCFAVMSRRESTSLEHLIRVVCLGEGLASSGEWQTIEGALNTLRHDEAIMGREPELLKSLCDWAPVARRYSFAARPH